MKIPSHQGLTLIEVLIAATLVISITGLIARSFFKVNSTEALDKNADLVVSVLNEARTMTLSAIDDSRYGVHFDAGQVVLFKGVAYATSTSTNIPTSLNALVGLSDISVSGGGLNVLFNRLTGATSQTGTVRIYLKSATTTYKTITVSATGLIERN